MTDKPLEPKTETTLRTEVVKLLGRKEALRAYAHAEGTHYDKLKAVQKAVLRHNGFKPT